MARKLSLVDAIALIKIRCSHCHQVMEVHAYGKNKKRLKEMGTTKPIASMACWTNACPEKGKEKFHIDKEGV